MIGEIKAIETRYNGYLFRSRLEARWAYAWDLLGMKYEYEKEGFDLGDDGYYLPDFWLPAYGWVEIKGQTPTIEECHKCARLAERGDFVYLLYGPIGEHRGYGWAKFSEGVDQVRLSSDDTLHFRDAFMKARAARFEHI